MSQTIVITSDLFETRVALLERNRPVELYIERKRSRGIAGNIYKGRVTRVLPGMQSAFVDIGLERAAFLYVKDVEKELDEELDGIETEMVETGASECLIQDLLKKNQEILVQVSKDALGNKGPRITSHISIPGRNLVYMPMIDHVGVSKKIENTKERARLKELLHALKPKGIGVIVRTASEGIGEQEIKNELAYLGEIWLQIKKEADRRECPALIYKDFGLTLKAVRDLATKNVSQVIVDQKEDFDKVRSFVAVSIPTIEKKVKLYKDSKPLFDHYKITPHLEKAVRRKVWLKSGGYINIDHTEALVSIDVNTGRYVGKGDLEQTILKINLEAAKEIAYQLRLRNLGGIIVIDFIDMEVESHRKKVFDAFEAVLKKDRAKTSIFPISDLGILQMTRKRTRETVSQVLTEPCVYCNGSGVVQSAETTAIAILRQILGYPKKRNETCVTLTAHANVIELIKDSEVLPVKEIEALKNIRLVLKENLKCCVHEFDIQVRRSSSKAPSGSAS